MIELLHGDCLERLRELPDSSVDACVTDPPYGLSFMGKAWDYDVPGAEVWREVLRVLKPGGHLLAFAGTRTQHRMAVQIEDAGFEIRDMIAWVYGSGFPKSLDVSKAIDKRKDWTLVERLAGEIRRARTEAGLSLAEIGEATMAATAGAYGKWYHRGGHMFFETGRSLPSRPEWDQLRHVLPIALEFAAVYEEAEREVVGQRTTGIGTGGGSTPIMQDGSRDITAPATPEAQQWNGWGTALKPALEPITVARKPFKGNVAANVLEHGTGAINIDGCRVPGSYETRNRQNDGGNSMFGMGAGGGAFVPAEGRWPANLIHDGSEEVTELFPYQRNGGANLAPTQKAGTATNIMSGTGMSQPTNAAYAGDSGSAARFFYCAKASKADRGAENVHPTVKPTELMRYLCRLVTPPGGVVLDPFMGSGSTGKAAALEGFRFIGIEREAEYLEIARGRIQVPEQVQKDLF
jgi:SAM-dependent methyltransferase